MKEVYTIQDFLFFFYGSVRLGYVIVFLLAAAGYCISRTRKVSGPLLFCNNCFFILYSLFLFAELVVRWYNEITAPKSADYTFGSSGLNIFSEYGFSLYMEYLAPAVLTLIFLLRKKWMKQLLPSMIAVILVRIEDIFFWIIRLYRDYVPYSMSHYYGDYAYAIRKLLFFFAVFSMLYIYLHKRNSLQNPSHSE
jgi:hypothetical protein